MIQLPQDVHPLAQIGNSLAPFANMLGNLYQQRQQLAMNLEAQQAQRNALQQAYQQNQGQGAQQLFSGLLSAPGGAELAQQLINQVPAFRAQFGQSFGPIAGLQAGQPGQQVPPGQAPVAPLDAAAQQADTMQQELGVTPSVPRGTIPGELPTKRGVEVSPSIRAEDLAREPTPQLYTPTAEGLVYQPEIESAKETASLKRATKSASEQAIVNERNQQRLNAFNQLKEASRAQFPNIAGNPEFERALNDFSMSVVNRDPNAPIDKQIKEVTETGRYLQNVGMDVKREMDKSLKLFPGIAPFKVSLPQKDLERVQKTIQPLVESGFQTYAEDIINSYGLNPFTTSAIVDPLSKNSSQILNSIPESKKMFYLPGDKPEKGFHRKREQQVNDIASLREQWNKANPQTESKVVPLVARMLEQGEMPFTIREALVREKNIPPPIVGDIMQKASDNLDRRLNSLQARQMQRIGYTNEEIYDDMVYQSQGLLEGLINRFRTGASE